MKGSMPKKLKYPRSYEFETEKDTQIKRNCHHLFRTKEKIDI